MPGQRKQKDLETQLEEARAVIAAMMSAQFEDLALPDAAAPLLVREARAALVANEKRFRALVENTSDAMALLGPDGRVQYVSPAITPMLGYEPAALVGKLGFAMIHPRDRKRLRKLFASAIWDGSDPHLGELRGRHADGSVRDLELSLVSRLDDPSVGAMVATFRDVTQRKQVEATLVRLAAIVESSRDAIIGVSLDGVITSWNGGAERMYGYTAEEAVRRPVQMLAPPDRQAEVRGILRRQARGETIAPFETTRVRKDGARIDVAVTFSPIHDRAGEIVGSSVIARDITEHKMADAALRQSEERYRALMEQANDAILLFAPGNTILEANRRAEQILGRPRAELIGMFYDDLVPSEERESSQQARQALLAQGTIGVSNRHLQRPDGSRVPVDISAAVVHVGDEPLLLGILRDVTERQRTEDALRRSATRLKAVLDGALDAVIGMDASGNVVSWNPRAEAIFGWTAEEAIGSPVSELIVPPDQRRAHTAGVARFLATGRGNLVGRRVEMSAVRKDGTVFPIELSVVAVENEGNTLFTAFIADITERIQAGVRLAESEQQYRLLFDANAQPMWVMDEQTRAFIAVNDAAVARYGWSREEFLAMALPDIHPEEMVAPLLEALARADVQRGPARFGIDGGGWRHRTKDGIVMEVEGGASPIVFRGRRAWLGHASDVTDRKKLEAQLHQSQKIESVGRLAAGIAHDFNNMLSVITGYGEILGRRMGSDSPLRRYVDDILRSADRATALTRQLLAFSRQQVLQLGIHDVNTIVADIEKMLRRLIGEDVELATVLGEDLAPVRADTSQLQQVLMNLVVNARDAMPRGGRILVETSTVALDESYAARHPDVPPGSYTVIAVSDTGHGIPPEVQSRIFEPFFTTKAPGKGTGLGLATVHGIVKQTGGHIFVDSEVGRGTTFKVYLPAAEARGAPSAAVQVEPLPMGSGTVLLVEDEPSLRAIIQEILEEGGYSVLNAADAPAARLLSQHAGKIDLLITDVVMPGTGGSELARELTARRTDMKVLYMSGYTDDAVILHGVVSKEMPFLEKPFTASSLLGKVQEILGPR